MVVVVVVVVIVDGWHRNESKRNQMTHKPAQQQKATTKQWDIRDGLSELPWPVHCEPRRIGPQT